MDTDAGKHEGLGARNHRVLSEWPLFPAIFILRTSNDTNEVKNKCTDVFAVIANNKQHLLSSYCVLSALHVLPDVILAQPRELKVIPERIRGFLAKASCF